MKIITKVVTFLLLFICSVGCEVSTPIELGTITGTVTDGTSLEPLQGVSVAISPTGKTLTTGSDGLFEFSNLEAGQYTVSVSKENYNSDSKIINVQSGTSISDFAITTGNGSIELSKSTLDFGSADNTLVFDIENIGKSDMTYTIEYDSYDWISVSPKTGTISSSRIEPITVNIDRTKIVKDMSITLPISSNAGSAEVILKVTKEVAVAVMTLSKTSLDFGETNTTLSFDITNSGNADLEYSIPSLGDYITFSPSSKTLTAGSTSTVVATIDRTKITSSISQTMTISSNVGSKEISVVVTKAAEAGILNVSTTLLDFGEDKDSLSFTISNSGTASFEYTIKGNYSWLAGHNVTGTVEAGNSVTVTLYIYRDNFSGQIDENISVYSTVGEKYIEVKAYEPIDYGTVSSCDRDIDITVTDVTVSGTTAYIGFKMINNSSTTISAFRVGQPLSGLMYAIDDKSNTYYYDNRDVLITVNGKSILSYSAFGYVSNTFMGNGASLVGEIEIRNIDSSANLFKSITVGTYGYSSSGNQIDETSFTLYNVPIIR